MHEFELIERLKPMLPTNDFVVAGAGDDCAVLDLGEPQHQTLFKTDAVVEGIHFTRETDPSQVGHKAMARCLSDIAAMGGSPVAALVTLALPRQPDAGWCQQMYAGLCRTAARFQTAVVGGETSTNPDRILLSIAMIGRVPRGRAIRRSGARPGDALFVSGKLGGSMAGHHLDFEPRLAEAQWLAEHFDIHAMIDLSDGLAGDLRHVLMASGGLGAEIHGAAVPVSAAARENARSIHSPKPALLAALTDGEDFELLFCVAPGDAVKLLDGWKARFPLVPLSCIGKVTAGPEVVLRDREGTKPMPRAAALSTFKIRNERINEQRHPGSAVGGGGSMTVTIHRTRSAAETEALGQSIARSCPPGTVLGLTGELGAGKTAFVRGFARGLGCPGRAHSPTFALFHEYHGGRCRLFHLDLHRLQDATDVTAAGLEEYLVKPDGIALVEWVERWLDGGPPPAGLEHWSFEVVDETTRDIRHESLVSDGRKR